MTETVTDYAGYWRSGNGTGDGATLNAVQPDNSHLLLAFTLNGTRFSTGINNALLDTKGLAYKAGKYQALSVAGLGGSVSSNTKVALGQLYDKVDNGASSPPPASGYAQYLTDGTQELDLGTGVANLPGGNLNFKASSVTQSAIGDEVPDVLITQIASPGNVGDKYQFLDANGSTVGNVVTVVFTNVPVIGKWVVDFYEASASPMTLATGFTKTQRDLRLWAADFSAFGITASDYSRIKSFQITFSGDSDQAFVAYNTSSLNFQPLPVVLTAFGAWPRAAPCT